VGDAPVIGLVTTTAAGRRAAAEIACLGETKRYDVRELSRAWAECEALVLFLATGAAVRLLAPLHTDKRTDPGVVCVDEGRRFAVALVGGHAGGANELAHQVADLLGCEPVVTTGTDAVGLAGLDSWGWPAEGDLARVGRALLDGEPVRLEMDPVHPIPPLPVADHGELVIAVTDRDSDADVVLRPPSLVLGIGASKGVKVEELEELVVGTLAAHGLSTLSVAHVATVEAKADEGGIVGLCAKTGWPLVTHPASVLAATEVPNPSAHPLEAVGTPSVAEAAALQHGALVVEKTKSPMATLAVSRIRPRGRLSVVGLGPGARDLLTPRAVEALRG
jgi:cobalt-precorrin 5A hydrolase/precorrin-3B C17-methyltransferase